MMKSNRRSFIKNTALATAGATYFMSANNVWAFSSNETVNAAILGTGGRAHALAQSIGLCSNIKLATVCDVDNNRLEKFKQYSLDALGYKVKGQRDFRKVLEDKSIDVVFVATPEHWHAPMAIMGMQAGKHVYVEKPCSHNLYENELLVNAYKKYGKLCQMGNQQRSSITSNQAIKDIRDGKIGDPYYAKAWYANTRGSIGQGKNVAVPDYLDWDLWQGPAPRENYRDNVHPYNWHWFRTWGTGEIHNNGTHEIDVCRWALGAGLPSRVTSTGGRLHFSGDDWQYYDTQLANFEYADGKTIQWEGKSCNGMGLYGRGRGAIIHGTKGSVLLDRAGYQLLDLQGKEISYVKEGSPGTSASTSDTSGFDGLTVKHIQNFVNTIAGKEKLNAPIDDASMSTHMCHLGNIAQDLKVSLNIDKNGKILDNPKASAKVKREYEPGWEPKL
ncbi:Gfo/Idh/MocA family protein [Marinoscillum pacificum]|uniref:Gfo/Idh/MocA family protein n=1 Tax=Marinoscillum pacificum TaxID=392723 RepID=UPI0021572452|nr:Gfo/Idh/MocA family oxidoreductase [Marinoscillum pacificum]